MTRQHGGLAALLTRVVPIIALVFAIEGALMLVLPALHLEPGSVVEALADASILSAVMLPLFLHIENRRVRAEASVRELVALVNQSEDIVVGTTLDGIITHWNAAAERQHGFRADEVVGRPATVVLPPEEQHQVRALLDRLKAGERISQYELVAMRKDETRFDASVSVASILDSIGSATGVVVSVRDISAKKRAREEQARLVRELQESLETIRTLRGLLPICASCKRIHNARGGWEQVEVYIRDHSQAEFSHGICPDCARRLYDADGTERDA